MADISKLPVITISREYGAGGRSIAKELSKRLGIPWYDRDFVRLTAKDSGYSEDEIDKEGEEISDFSIFLKSMLNNIVDYTSSHDAIFSAQKEEMIKLAQNPCIIVGRCGNCILHEAGIQSFDIFLYASMNVRMERAKSLIKEPCDDIRKYVEKKDALREKYYKEYTKREISKAQDYSICLDTGVIDYDTCVDMIARLFE
ncbi:MAG: cytidylate kinase-like family protein [Lachnospiraceae bacterium]|nr:cytidylate kinase-like family protein [Lachnospiraceae bacterium]